MRIDWEHFTPWLSFTGGILIGLAAALFVLVNGRIAGISGIVAGLLEPKHGDIDWRLCFLLGLVTAPSVYGAFADLPPIQIDADWATLVIAGLLVGIGTRLGAGCTSGHGVCGLSRLSPRSLVATVSFMTAGFITVFLVRHLSPGWGEIMVASFLFGLSMRFAPECSTGLGLCALPESASRSKRIIFILVATCVLALYSAWLLLRD